MSNLLFGAWREANIEPLKGGTYLVILADGNDLGIDGGTYLLAEYDFVTNISRTTLVGWTIYSETENERVNIDADITHWMSLPQPPASEDLLLSFADLHGISHKAALGFLRDAILNSISFAEFREWMNCR